jgi:hypothetical protein
MLNHGQLVASRHFAISDLFKLERTVIVFLQTHLMAGVTCLLLAALKSMGRYTI